jgi:hypothetical protein
MSTHLVIDGQDTGPISNATTIGSFFKPDWTLLYNRIDLTPYANSYVSVLKPGTNLAFVYTNPPSDTGYLISYDTVPEANLKAPSNLYTFKEFSESPGIYTENFEGSLECAAQAASIGIAAWGPQEEMLYNLDEKWIKDYSRVTQFSTVPVKIPVYSQNFLGTPITIKINPREYGDLITNFVLRCSIPPNINIIDRVGLALIKRAELFIDEVLIDIYDDNWAIIREQLFDSADVQAGRSNILNGSNLAIPLDFFCRDSTYFPITCLGYQNIYLRLTFNTRAWVTNSDTSPFDLTNVSLTFDQIFLTDAERFHIRNTPQLIRIPKVTWEVPTNFTSGFVNQIMTANYDVSMIVWFIKNQIYNDPNQTGYEYRYSFGYTSPLTKTYTNYTDWRGNTVPLINTLHDVSIFINNKNIVSNFSDDVYFQCVQPDNHGLSVPSKSIGVYCFAEKPKNLWSTGTVNFRTIQSKTTNLQINFRSSLVPQLLLNYQMYLYYYGYTTLSLRDGAGTVLDL